jgi:Cu+-exporting ATPase
MNYRQFIIHNLHCASCIRSIEKQLQKISKKQLQDFQINFSDKSLFVKGSISTKQIEEQLQQIGYRCERVLEGEESTQSQKKQEEAEYCYYRNRAWVAIIFGGALMIYGWSGGVMQVVNQSDQILWSFVALISLCIIVYSGGHFYRSAIQKIKYLQTNMDSLIAISSSIAWFYSCFILLFPDIFPENAKHFYFEASVMIIGLVNLGFSLEIKTKKKTYQTLESLLQIQAKTAKLVDPKTLQEKETPICDIERGDWIRVLSGEKIPLDAEILKGESNVDESALTGEFAPVFKTKGMEVIGGSMNLEGSFLAKVKNTSQSSLLSQIIALVKKAQSSKPPIARLADKIAGVFVPIILVIAFLTAVFWFFFAPLNTLLLVFVTSTCVLIIACPCALGLATPISVMAGIQKAAKSGILIHSAKAMQDLSVAGSLVLDKTGTITEGKPQIVDFHNFSGQSKQKILQIAISLELGTKHPFASAFLKLGKQEKSKLLDVKNFENVIGRGVKGKIAGEEFFLGSEQWLKKLGFLVDKKFSSKAASSQIFLATKGNKEILACFSIADNIKKNSAAVIKKMQKRGLKIFIASGDRQENVDFIAKKCGIKKAFGLMSPQEKRQKVLELKKQGEKIIFVGDGTNDAPALAEADVGMAMSSGTDIAMESASIVLMGHSLEKIMSAMEISKQTLRNMKQNLFFAFAYNVVCIPIAAGLLYPFGILLNPVFAALAMSLSSLTLVLNSVRLYFSR